jgi:hypothetical protein
MFSEFITEIYFFTLTFVTISVMYLFGCCFIEFASKIKQQIDSLEEKMKIIKTEEKEKTEICTNDGLLFELGQSCKGIYLKDSIDYNVSVLHLIYNWNQMTVYGLSITNKPDSRIHSISCETIDKIQEDIPLRNLQEPFTISLDRILRPSYRSSSLDHKVQMISNLFKHFRNLEKVIVHNNEKVNILKLNACITPSLEKIKKEIDIEIEIWNTPEEGFVEKKSFN